MNSGSQLSRMLYQSYLVSGSHLSRLLSSDAGTLGWSDPVSHDCGSFVECGPTIMPHSPAKSIFRLHVISSVHTHSKPLGHDFRTKKWSVIKCVVSTVLCCDMEHGAQMSVTLRCLLQQKPNEVSRRSVQFPLKNADKSKPLHPIFRLFSKQPTTDKKGW